MFETRNAPASSPNRNRGFVSLLLLTAGVRILVERLFSVPHAGDLVPLAVGVKLLTWAKFGREDGLLIAGGILAGVGGAAPCAPLAGLAGRAT